MLAKQAAEVDMANLFAEVPVEAAEVEATKTVGIAFRLVAVAAEEVAANMALAMVLEVLSVEAALVPEAAEAVAVAEPLEAAVEDLGKVELETVAAASDLHQVLAAVEAEEVSHPMAKAVAVVQAAADTERQGNTKAAPVVEVLDRLAEAVEVEAGREAPAAEAAMLLEAVAADLWEQEVAEVERESERTPAAGAQEVAPQNSKSRH